MSRAKGDGEQLISNGLVYIGGKPYSIKHGEVVQLESGKWVLPDSPEVIEHLAQLNKADRNPGETPGTAKHSLGNEREGGAKQLENATKHSLEELQERAAPILAMDDPLVRLEESIRAIGFGGRTKHVTIPYLAATSRVLAMERGNMPVHTGLHPTKPRTRHQGLNPTESWTPIW